MIIVACIQRSKMLLPENTHHKRKYHSAADLLFILYGFSCFAESKPVKQEVSRTVILSLVVSVLW